MPRRPPIDPQGCYHVSTRGNFGMPLFTADHEHELYLELYAKQALKFGWTTIAWALIWNHHHFVVQLTNGGLSEGMRTVNHGFSRRINATYGRTGEGHCVRHSFYAGQITSDEQLLATCRYVDLNAVQAKQCRRPQDWRWCGYAATVGLANPRAFHDPGLLLELFGNHPHRARQAYRRFVESGSAGNGLPLFPGNGYESVTT